MSEWSKIYQTLTPEPGEGKEIFQIVPGKGRDITKREKQKSRVAIAPYPAAIQVVVTVIGPVRTAPPGVKGYEPKKVSECLHYSSKRLCNALNVMRIQACDTHAAAGNQIDAKLFTQTIDLLHAQPGVAEHPALLEQIIEVMLR